MDMLDVDLEAAAAAPDARDAPRAATAAHESVDASTARLTSSALPSAALGRRQRRPRVSKRLQRVLLAKYVARAREWGRLPDRGATEQLLAEGYADLYCSGGGGGGGVGGVGEPRLSYAAFMKLVRNRRCEFARCSSAGEGKRQTRVEAGDVSGLAGENDQEHQQEIRALIEELDELRQRMAPPRVPQDYGLLAGEEEIQQHQQQCQTHHNSTTHHQLQTMMDEAGVPMLSEDGAELTITGDGETDNSVVDGDLSTSESYGSVGSRAPSETVVVSRVQLDQMLRSAQESLRLQRKLLDDVRAIEQRLSGIQ